MGDSELFEAYEEETRIFFIRRSTFDRTRHEKVTVLDQPTDAVGPQCYEFAAMVTDIGHFQSPSCRISSQSVDRRRHILDELLHGLEN